ncbi:MAG: type II toxin-antitoxin system mRNA interferase toxin, RelE/StbE family [Candidatus Gottesmanbacteria bacterium]|nr:type II toxin-antitoxin system mRNA interferase toxin, RelE/StbE family [Candidatus Gottesmanbacteria bacterium]
MTLYVLPAFVRARKRLIKRDPKKAYIIKEKIELFRKDPKNPALKLHKLSGFEKDTWSFSISYELRILISYSGQDILLVDIGTHDELY